MRYVAVSSSKQKSGIGRMMNEEFEAESLRRGYSRIYAHARGYALEFYIKLGYEAFGEPFTEVTIPHRHVQKYLKKAD